MKSLSPVRLLATPWTTAYQAPPTMGFSSRVLEWGAIVFSEVILSSASIFQGMCPLARSKMIFDNRTFKKYTYFKEKIYTYFKELSRLLMHEMFCYHLILISSINFISSFLNS